MSNLEKYVEKVKRYKENNPNLTETELVRYVYLDLGNKFSFDDEFYFARERNRRKMYKESIIQENLEDAMQNKKIICNSLSYILKYIYSELGIDTEVVKDKLDPNGAYKHVFNVVHSKEREDYGIDLQIDIRKIQSRSRTLRFGFSPEDLTTPLISRKELEEIDKKLRICR